jgi:Holliday junction resolvase-like predicted endonuclease
MPAKLKEGDVIRHVCRHLEENGYEVLDYKETYQHGVDIKARKRDDRSWLWVEAKGQTSSNEESARYEVGFNKGQEEDHLGKAILKCLRYLSSNNTEPKSTAIAVPRDEYHNEIIPRILPFLEKLGIAVFLVDAAGGVEALGLARKKTNWGSGR